MCNRTVHEHHCSSTLSHMASSHATPSLSSFSLKSPSSAVTSQVVESSVQPPVVSVFQIRKLPPPPPVWAIWPIEDVAR